MILDIGNLERIENPTAEQIIHYLRHLASDSFLILDADAQLFIQATLARGGRYRVEWRQEDVQRFAIVPLEQAEALLLAFARWDEAGLEAVKWRRLGLLNDPYRRSILLGSLFLLAVLFLQMARWWLH